MKCALTSQPFVNNEAAWAQSARVLRKKDMYTCFFSYIFLYTLQQEEVGEKSWPNVMQLEETQEGSI